MEITQAEIVRYKNLIFDRRYLFIIISFCIMSLIVWGSYFIPKKYKASSTIFIESNVIEELVKGIAITPSMDARIRILNNTMLSRSLVLSVLRKLDLDSRAENDEELERMIMKFQKKTDIRIRNGNLITVSFVNKDPVLAKDFINNLVREYVEKNIFAKREEAYDATKFLSKQVDFFKARMDKGEEAVIKYRQEQGIYIVMNEASIISEISRYTEEIEQMEIRENALAAAKKSIEKQLAEEKPFTVAVFDTDDIDGNVAALESRLKQLLISYTENYPEVTKIKAEIKALENLKKRKSEATSVVATRAGIETSNPVYLEIKQNLNEVKTEIDSMQAKKKYLKMLISRKEKELRDIPESRKKLVDLEKERDSFKDVYEQLLVRLGQSEVSKQMEVEDKTTTFRIIEPAILPTVPVSPNRILLILAGIVVGFISGGGVIVILDLMNNSIKSLDGLKALGLPVLAVIPRMQSEEAQGKIRKKDMLLYGFTGLYMVCILGVLAMEFLGMTYIERFVSSILVKQL